VSRMRSVTPPKARPTMKTSEIVVNFFILFVNLPITLVN
jgi:hypothetical protein